MRWLAIPLLIFVTLAQSLGASADLVITKEVALKAIVIFRDNPLSEDGQGAAALIIKFVDQNHDVLVGLTKKTVPILDAPGVSQKEKALLLAAFAAGNADSQLLRGVKKDDPYAGDLQLIQTYRQLQKKNPRLKITAVEKLAEMEQRGELKHYLTSK